MSARRLPVRPDLDQLKHQAKDLLRAVRAGDPAALAEFRQYHPEPPESTNARLADAQLALARAYQAPSWPRLVMACKLVDAIWQDDVETVRDLVTRHPQLLHEAALIRESNWGRPMSYAANLGRDRIITLLHELGAKDLEHAIGRATLQSRIGTARMLHAMLGAPRPTPADLGGPAYTLSESGTALMFEFGVELRDAQGRPDAPVDVVLQTDSRNPAAKHAILQMYAEHGFPFADTPTMALHRGRIDLLAALLEREPSLLQRTFRYEEIFPPELRCHEEQLPRTTLAGATLLHLCVEHDELEIARWLLERGMAADAPAGVDSRGFGGHTALFGAVACYANFWGNYRGGWYDAGPPTDSPMARLLLDHGADPNARASMREQVMSDYVKQEVREHRNLTPLGWGRVFHDRRIVSEPAMRLVAERGGIAG